MKFASFTQRILEKELIYCYWGSTGTEKGNCVSVDFLTALAIVLSETAPLTLKIVLYTPQVLVVCSSVMSVL